VRHVRDSRSLVNLLPLWIGFTALVLTLLAVDLLIFNKQAHRITIKEASIWSAFLVTLALSFAGFLYFYLSPEKSLEFLTGYLIEEALSVDNVFVFVLIFSYFRVPPEYQHRVLFWGVLGAMIGRGIMIGAGTILIHRFHWIIYVFGVFLVITGIRMGLASDMSVAPERNPVLKLVRRFMRVSSTYHHQRFFVKEAVDSSGKLHRVATPLFVVLVVVETTDLVFAVDSIPAIFAITRDPFIVYSSNVLAILGLRALYFVLADVIHRFHYLKLGLSGVLAFVGLKMIITDLVDIPITVSLGVVAIVLAGSIIGSLLFPRASPGSDPGR
jgi:tellurite resistance protein TerC